MGVHSPNKGVHAGLENARLVPGLGGAPHATPPKQRWSTPSPQNLRAQKSAYTVGFRPMHLKLLTTPHPRGKPPLCSVRAHRCTFTGNMDRHRAQPCDCLCFDHRVFEWEHWEQWEHRMNKGSPRSHWLFGSGNSGNKFQGVPLFLHICGSFRGPAQIAGADVQSPTAPTERQGFCTLVLFTGGPPAARKEPLPAPSSGRRRHALHG